MNLAHLEKRFLEDFTAQCHATEVGKYIIAHY
jgi:hypothetical protein